MIEAQDLTKKFNGKTVLSGINFHVNEGEIFGYLGPNGAGKTTTMRILLGLLKPASGRALVFGKELGDNDDLRRKVGVLLENDGLYERLSAHENLNYYAQLYSVSDTEGRIKNLLNFVGLSDRQNDIVGVFSKGMKRRLALARSILHDPEVLFYDEPSAGLDPEAQKMVRDLILRLAREKGRTIFLNSHDLDEVQRVCSKIAILQRGEIKAYDTVENLRRKISKPAVEIVLDNDRQAEKALDLLNSLDYVFECERDGLMITAIIEGEKTSTILGVLMKDGLRVEEVKKATKSLEDIYLNIVRQSEERM
ncbi:MAG: ABC transporter ATP-binding protein [Candidatus Bathyarchaeota archaeon]|nr:MAG: ABC transporter ATP-binding protein [Candidatus Bathyarchaeota archaeon]